MFFINECMPFTENMEAVFKRNYVPQSKPLKRFLMGIGRDVFQVTSRASLHDALPLSREEFCGPIRGFLNSARGGR